MKKLTDAWSLALYDASELVCREGRWVENEWVSSL